MKRSNWPDIAFVILLPIIISVNIYGLYETRLNIQQAKTIAAQNQTLAATSQANTRQIEKQINCISLYFNTPNRTGNTTINNLNSCDIKP